MKALTVVPFIIGLAGAGLFGYSLTQQTQIQSQMNQTMSQINDSIASTGKTVQETSTVLSPLLATTTSLANIEQSEEHTVGELMSMNRHLATIGQTEQQIIHSLDNLNQVTQNVSLQISGVTSSNTNLLNSNLNSVSQANVEAGQVGQLNQMTDTSIALLHTINSRLSMLKALP